MTSMVAGQSMYQQYAAPATYAAAPTMTSMYATPGASMYMPTTTMAAPVAYEASMYTAAPTMVDAGSVMYAAPTMVQTPSYVAAPVQQVVAAPTGPQFAMPQPTKLTTGLTEPAKLEAEKVAYGKALEGQLQKQSAAAMEEAKIKKAMLEQQAKTQLAQFQLQMEEQVKMAFLQIDQEAQTECNGLEEAAITQKTSLEERAAIAIADYKKKKALEEMSVKSWEMQKQWFEQESKMVAQYQQVMQKGARAVVTPAMPQVQQMAAPMTMVYG